VAQLGSDMEKKASSFAPEKDRAVVYLYRSYDSGYGIFAEDVDINDKSVRSLSNGYLRVSLPAGDYTMRIPLHELTSQENELKVKLKGNEVTFIEMQLKARVLLGGVTSLHVVSKKDALKDFMAHKRVPQEPVSL